MHVYHVSFHAANAWTDLSKLPKILSLGKLNATVKELNTSLTSMPLLERYSFEASQHAAFRFVFIACSLTRLRDVGM